MGTGIAVHSAGYVITNRHVVAESSSILATLASGEQVQGKILGADPATDLAVVLLPSTKLEAATLGDSERVRVGTPLVAIGHSLGLPGGPTASFGVLSARHRPLPGAEHVLEGLLQTDAAVNPGNSGGPLATLTPEVIGITTAMVPFAQGVGFAVPSSTVRLVLRDLIDHGRVLRPWIGIWAGPHYEGVETTPSGLAVAEVHPEGPAASAGLRQGDILVRVAEQPTPTIRDLLLALRSAPLGSEVSVQYRRGQRVEDTRIVLREAPELPEPPSIPSRPHREPEVPGYG